MRIGWHVRTNKFFKQLQHLALFGVTAGLLLGIEQFVIYPNIEHTFGAGNKRKRINEMLVMREDIIRRTDGSRAVVSRHAVFEGYLIFFVHVASVRSGPVKIKPPEKGLK